MTTIHIKPRKVEHFPAALHDSLYEKNGGWIIRPSETVPFLEISENAKQNIIDIHIPGVPADHITVQSPNGYIKEVTRLGPYDEIVHILLPKKQKSHETALSRSGPKINSHMVFI